MKLMDKYLLREYLTHAAYCFGAFFMLYVVIDLFTHLNTFLDADLSFSVIVFYYLCLMAPVLEYLIPASLLLACLYTLWTLTRNNEFTAMRASGLSLFRIMMPFLGVGMALTVFSAAIKEQVSPAANYWAENFSDSKFLRLHAEAYRDVAYFNATTRRQWLIKELDPSHPDRIAGGVEVKQERSNGSRSEQIRAERAEWREGAWWFYNAVVENYDAADNPVRRQKVTGAPLSRRYSEQPRDLLNEAKPWEFLSSLEMARYIATHPDLSPRNLSQKRYDLHNRLAMPWACLIVTLFGIPAGARGGRHSALAGIFLAFAFFFGYYALTHVGMFLGKREVVWPWVGAWLSNTVFLGAGVALLTRLR